MVLTGVNEAELHRLRDYVDRVRNGETFTPAEATDLRDLSDRVAREHPGEEWVGELLKLALFIYAVDAVAADLSSGKGRTS